MPLGKSSLFCILIAALVSLVRCDQAYCAQQGGPDFRGITLDMVEIAHDGIYPLESGDPFRKVDANAVLKLTFSKPQLPAKLVISENWKSIDEILRQTDLLLIAYEEISREAAAFVERKDVAQWKTKVERNFYKPYSELIRKLMQSDTPAVSKDDVPLLVDLADKRNTSFLQVLFEHLTEKRKEFYQRAEQFARDKDQYEVMVRGFLLPQVGDMQQLHIPGYDNIPGRALQPISRTGLIPTEAEAKRLNAENNGAKMVKTAIEEIKANESVIKDHIAKLVEQAKERLAVLVKDFQELRDRRDEDVIKQLDTIGTQHVNSINAELKRFQEDISLFRKLEQKIGEFRKIKYEDALELIMFLLQKQSEGAAILADIKTLADRVSTWPGRIEIINEHAEAALKEVFDKQGQAASDKVSAFLAGIRPDVQKATRSLSSDLPEVTAALTYLFNEGFLKNGNDILRAAAVLDPTEPGVIPRPLDNLEDAVLDLRRAGITVGDAVEVNVAFLNKSNPAVPEKTITYSGEAVLTGLHRRFSGDLIFAKAVNGAGSDEFKPNVGVSVEWHYYDREKPRGFLNWLDPGIGIHAANLDQDSSQTVELGAGVNVSLWGGLTRVGYGWNISVKKDREYYWIGFSLFGLLNQLNNLNLPSPTLQR